jgi:hypothetical protein
MPIMADTDTILMTTDADADNRKLATDCVSPNITKVCSGPGNGMIGNWEWTNPSRHRDGIDIWYYGAYIGHADFGVDATFTPPDCPISPPGLYNCHPVWTVTWRP